MNDSYKTFENTPDNKPIAYVLVGFPASGKSTWASNHPQNLPIASTDEFVERYADEHKVSYTEAFHTYFPQAREELKLQINQLTQNPVSFIWDQINLKRNERIKIHNRLSPTHNVIYVCFHVPVEECVRRYHMRKRDSGSIVNEEYIRGLTNTASFPKAGDEPFYKLIILTHPDWKE